MGKVSKEKSRRFNCYHSFCFDKKILPETERSSSRMISLDKLLNTRRNLLNFYEILLELGRRLKSIHNERHGTGAGISRSVHFLVLGRLHSTQISAETNVDWRCYDSLNCISFLARFLSLPPFITFTFSFDILCILFECEMELKKFKCLVFLSFDTNEISFEFHDFVAFLLKFRRTFESLF